MLAVFKFIGLFTLSHGGTGINTEEGVTFMWHAALCGSLEATFMWLCRTLKQSKITPQVERKRIDESMSVEKSHKSAHVCPMF